VEEILIEEGGAVASRVLVEAGVVDSPDVARLLLPERPARRRVAFVTQPGAAAVAGALADRVAAAGLDTAVHEIPDREEGKSLAAAEACYLWLNSRGMARSDTVVGVGGGTVIDLAGFVAATYMRGLEAVLVPTTLLAAVDAAIGGKTGVNVGGKNLVGAFKHPAVVLVDPAVLASLPDHLVVEGAAEALKTGFIGDPALVELYERHGLEAPMSAVVTRSIAVKAALVSADFKESGARTHLNYGHTIGHAVEAATGIPHGHAVAIGMAAAAAVAERESGFGERARHDRIIESLGLPVRAPAVSSAAVLDLVALDKKRDENGLRMVLLEAIGRPVVRHAGRATVASALASVGID
jgi:3-dehydroquinate synthase